MANDDFDVLLTPVLGAPPLLIGALQPRGAELFAQQAIARFKPGRALCDAAQVLTFHPRSPAAAPGPSAPPVGRRWSTSVTDGYLDAARRILETAARIRAGV
jgi:hypothetical protein